MYNTEEANVTKTQYYMSYLTLTEAAFPRFPQFRISLDIQSFHFPQKIWFVPVLGYMGKYAAIASI